MKTSPLIPRPPDRKRGWIQNTIARLPVHLVRITGALVGTLWYAVHSIHRNTVKRNIAFAFPEWSPEKVRKTVRQAFRHFGVTMIEVIQLSVRVPDEFKKYYRLEGQEYIQDALKKNKGLLMISAHVGNWEVGMQMMTCFSGTRVVAIAKKFKHPQLNDWVHLMRTRLGGEIIYKKGAMPTMVDALRQNQIVGVHIDMSRQTDGIDIEFFGHTATATPAAALLALRHKCPVMPVTCLRDLDGKIVVRAGKPLELVRTKNLREDLKTNTQLMTDTVENAIRSNPVQWWWTQKRWKDYFPELYPEHYSEQVKKLRERLDQKRIRMKNYREKHQKQNSNYSALKNTTFRG